MTTPQDLADRLEKFKAEFEAFVTSDDEYGDHEFGQFCQKNHALILASLRRSAPASGETFQARVKPWLDACFGPQIAIDKVERNHRFLEESLELVQSTGCTQSEAHQLVDYVYGRPIGDIEQEVGGVMNTLAALCLAHSRDMHADAEKELALVWTKIEKIRAKQAAKPKHSPLPEIAPASGEMREAVEAEREACAAIAEQFGDKHRLGNSKPNLVPAKKWVDLTCELIAEDIRARTPSGETREEAGS